MATITKDVDGYSCWSSRWLGIQWQFKPEHCHWWELTANAKHQHRRDFNHVQLRLGRWFSARIYFPVIIKPGEVAIPSQWSESGFRTEHIPKRYGFCIAGDQYTPTQEMTVTEIKSSTKPRPGGLVTPNAGTQNGQYLVQMVRFMPSTLATIVVANLSLTCAQLKEQ